MRAWTLLAVVVAVIAFSETEPSFFIPPPTLLFDANETHYVSDFFSNTSLLNRANSGLQTNTINQNAATQFENSDHKTGRQQVDLAGQSPADEVLVQELQLYRPLLCIAQPESVPFQTSAFELDKFQPNQRFPNIC